MLALNVPGCLAGVYGRPGGAAAWLAFCLEKTFPAKCSNRQSGICNDKSLCCTEVWESGRPNNPDGTHQACPRRFEGILRVDQDSPPSRWIKLLGFGGPGTRQKRAILAHRPPAIYCPLAAFAVCAGAASESARVAQLVPAAEIH